MYILEELDRQLELARAIKIEKEITIESYIDSFENKIIFFDDGLLTDLKKPTSDVDKNIEIAEIEEKAIARSGSIEKFVKESIADLRDEEEYQNQLRKMKPAIR